MALSWHFWPVTVYSYTVLGETFYDCTHNMFRQQREMRWRLRRGILQPGHPEWLAAGVDRNDLVLVPLWTFPSRDEANKRVALCMAAKICGGLWSDYDF